MPQLGAVVLAIGVLLGIGLGLIGAAPTVPVVLAIVAPMGILIGFVNVQVIAWIQARVADNMRGRVMSLVLLGSVGLAPVSLAATGVLLDLGAATLTFAFAGAICVAAALAGFAWGLPARMQAAGQLAHRPAARLLRISLLQRVRKPARFVSAEAAAPGSTSTSASARRVLMPGR